MSIAALATLPTPALIVDAAALQRNLTEMARQRPGGLLRPHVKAHKCTEIARAQRGVGHPGLTCATTAEVIGLARAGLADDVLLANESVDIARLGAMAAVAPEVTVAVDSTETIDAAVTAGVRRVVIDVNIGLPRCGCAPEQAGALAAHARRRGLDVRGVMGYEGHLMMLLDPGQQHAAVAEAMTVLHTAASEVGGEVISTGGTGTQRWHDDRVEVQAGSYALMDTHYAQLRLPFEHACWVLGTVISVQARWAVADVGLKALGMDHGNPSIDGATVWFCSDEHITFAPDPDRAVHVGDRIRVTPAHIDPTMAMHRQLHLIDGERAVETWPIDLRGW